MDLSNLPIEHIEVNLGEAERAARQMRQLEKEAFHPSDAKRYAGYAKGHEARAKVLRSSLASRVRSLVAATSKNFSKAYLATAYRVNHKAYAVPDLTKHDLAVDLVRNAVSPAAWAAYEGDRS